MMPIFMIGSQDNTRPKAEAELHGQVVRNRIT
jgi:hypothetical protein